MDVIHGRPIRDPARDAEREEREILNALGGDERGAANARERLDYALRHPGPGEIAERRADLMGDATVDHSRVEKILAKEFADRPSAYVVANGWTRQEAEAMNAHLDAKAAREWERSEPSAESVRKAERMADATDPMHDAWREAKADNHKPLSQSQRDAGRARTTAQPPTDDQRASQRTQAVTASQTLTASI